MVLDLKMGGGSKRCGGIICPLVEIGLTYLLKAPPPSTPKDDTPEYNTMLFKKILSITLLNLILTFVKKETLMLVVNNNIYKDQGDK